MDEPHRTIKRVPTNYRGKVGVRWRRQNERGGRHKKMSSAHQNGPTFHDESIEYSGEDVRPFGIIFNANNTTSAYRVKEKHNKISKNFRSWREAETHEEQSSENKNVVAKSQEIVSVGIKSKETDKSEEEKEENIGNLGCGGIELCSSELAETTKNQPNSTQKSSPILSNRAHLSSREKRIFFDPTSKRKERLFNHPTNKENASLTEEPLAVKHRGSIIPSPSTTTESSTPHRIEDTSGLNQKKRRILMTLPTAVSTEVFPHTMSYSLYNHFRPIDHEVPQEAIIPFLDFGRKLHSGSPSPSGANSLESSVEQKSRMRTPSTTARAEEDRLHDEMDVTLEKKTVERNNVPKLRVRPRGSSSIAGLFRKATSASAVPLAKRPDLIDCSKISKTNPPLNSDDHKLCPSIFGGSIENNTRTNTSVDSRPSNHKYSDETESVVRSGLKTNPRANHEIVNISHNFDSEFDVKSKIYHYEIEPSSPVAGLSSPPITSQLDFTGKVFTTTFKSSTVPNSAMNISESFFTSPSPSTLISEQEAVINQSGSPDVDFNRETNRSADQDTYKDESIDASSLSSVVTRKLTPNLKTTTESHHSVTNDDTVHVERSYLDSSLLRTTVVQPKSITLETPKLSSPSYQRYNSTSHSSKENGATSAESLIPSTILNETAVDYLRTSPTEAATTSEKTKIEDIAVIQTSATHIPFTEEKIEIIPSMENATSNYSVYESYSPSPAPNNYTRHQIFFKEHLTSTVTPASRSFPPAFNHKTNATAKSSVEDVGPVYPEGLGMLTYVLAVIGMVPLILAVIVVGRLLFGYNKKKVFDGSEYSSEYNRSPLEINGLVTSSPMTTKLPRVPQHLGWEMEKTCGLTIVPTPSTKWEFPREKLRLQTVLGQGNFGQVWKAEADDLSGHAGLTRLVAVKTVKEGASSKEREDLLRELGIMQDLGSHPNVVQLLGCCTEKEPYLLIMEYVMYGKLLSFLRDQRTRAQYYNFSDNGENLSSRDLTVFSYCVARGMDYLVSKGIIHRDLAARNVLVDHNKLCKIADFGMSRNVRDTGQIYEQRHSRGALPIRWMAPESLHYCLFTHKTDVWSFGVLVWEIVTLGLTPYSTMGAREVMRKIRNGYRLERPSHCKSELYQVMVDCWRANPADRPTFAELKKALCALLENAEYEGNYVDLESLAEEMSRQG